MLEKLKDIIISIKEDAQLDPDKISSASSLRSDLEFDSLQLAQLTVEIEDEFGVDIFEDEIVETVGDILKKLN
ncbi:MAG: acyl carrier protein [Saprospiraceae bacterium]|nr:acyl carrier protein [Saprospiraceae bacterium]